jgi:hypothetical protein
MALSGNRKPGDRILFEKTDSVRKEEVKSIMSSIEKSGK